METQVTKGTPTTSTTPANSATLVAEGLVVDTATPIQKNVVAFKEAGVAMVIRYYCSDTSDSKCLTPMEALAISEAGMKLGVVFQNDQTNAQDFSKSLGYEAGKTAFIYANETIGQPFGSVISFSVDFNPAVEEVEGPIQQYFLGVHEAFEDLAEGNEGYQIGAYGSGLTINNLYEQGLCSYRWLSKSASYQDTEEAIQSLSYDLVQLPEKEGKIDDVEVDYNKVVPVPAHAFSVYMPDAPEDSTSGYYSVNVSDNSFLNLRQDPDIDSESVAALKRNESVYVSNIDGNWAKLQVVINGKVVSGYAYAEYLEKIESA